MKHLLALLVVALWFMATSSHALPFDWRDPWGFAPDSALEARLPTPSSPTARTWSRPPLVFERNEGQFGPAIQFLVRGRGYQLVLGQGELVLPLHGEPWPHTASEADGPCEELGVGMAADYHPRFLLMRVTGTEAPLEGVGEHPLPAKLNYFIGNDPTNWRTNVSSYARVRYPEIYPGIDLVYYENRGELEYDFIVAPGGDPNRIELAIENADEVEVDVEGNLRLRRAGAELVWRRPVIFQEADGERTSISGKYVVRAAPAEQGGERSHRVAFQVSPYNPLLALVIDPVLVYSTYLGGAGNDYGRAIDVDQEGNAYVTGTTASLNFPILAALDPSWNGGNSADWRGPLDVFISKFSPDGELVFSTYLGGSGQDEGYAIAVDPGGIVYVAGTTESPSFPLANPVQSSRGGLRDAFVAGLTLDGRELVVSTFLGGSRDEETYQLALDETRALHLTGATRSTNFPVRNALQPGLSTPSPSDGTQRLDAFITKFAPGASNLVYSTFYGSEHTGDRAESIALDDVGNAYIAVSRCDNYGCSQVELLKLTPTGDQLLFTTSFGGNGILLDPSIAVGPPDRITLTAWTSIAELGTLNQPGPNFPDYADTIVAQFDANNGAFLQSAFLGGGNHDYAQSSVVDREGNILLLGDTRSPDFPTMNPLQPALRGSADLFLTKLRGEDLRILFSTYFGGSGSEFLYSPGALALGKGDEIHFTAQTSSIADFPLNRPFQSNPGGQEDAFVAKVSFGEALRITQAENLITLSWPTSAAGFLLETTTTLGPDTHWLRETTPASVVGDHYVVTLEIEPSERFFRLSKP